LALGRFPDFASGDSESAFISLSAVERRHHRQLIGVVIDWISMPDVGLHHIFIAYYWDHFNHGTRFIVAVAARSDPSHPT